MDEKDLDKYINSLVRRFIGKKNRRLMSDEDITQEVKIELLKSGTPQDKLIFHIAKKKVICLRRHLFRKKRILELKNVSVVSFDNLDNLKVRQIKQKESEEENRLKQVIQDGSLATTMKLTKRPFMLCLQEILDTNLTNVIDALKKLEYNNTPKSKLFVKRLYGKDKRKLCELDGRRNKQGVNSEKDITI